MDLKNCKDLTESRDKPFTIILPKESGVNKAPRETISDLSPESTLTLQISDDESWNDQKTEELDFQLNNSYQ